MAEEGGSAGLNTAPALGEAPDGPPPDVSTGDYEVRHLHPCKLPPCHSSPFIHLELHEHRVLVALDAGRELELQELAQHVLYRLQGQEPAHVTGLHQAGGPEEEGVACRGRSEEAIELAPSGLPSPPLIHLHLLCP